MSLPSRNVCVLDLFALQVVREEICQLNEATRGNFLNQLVGNGGVTRTDEKILPDHDN